MSKNDCSAGLVKLDLNEMVKICSIAVRNSKTELERYESSIQEHLFQASLSNVSGDEKYRHLCNAHTESEWLKRAASQYADSVDMYFYLMQAKDREEIRVIRE